MKPHIFAHTDRDTFHFSFTGKATTKTTYCFLPNGIFSEKDGFKTGNRPLLSLFLQRNHPKSYAGMSYRGHTCLTGKLSD